MNSQRRRRVKGALKILGNMKRVSKINAKKDETDGKLS